MKAPLIIRMRECPYCALNGNEIDNPLCACSCCGGIIPVAYESVLGVCYHCVQFKRSVK